MTCWGAPRVVSGPGGGVALTIGLVVAAGPGVAGNYGPMADDLLWRPQSLGAGLLWIWHVPFMLVLGFLGFRLLRFWTGSGAALLVMRMVSLAVVAGVWWGGAEFLRKWILVDPGLPGLNRWGS